MSSTSRTSLPSTSVTGAAFVFSTGSPKVRIEYAMAWHATRGVALLVGQPGRRVGDDAGRRRAARRRLHDAHRPRCVQPRTPRYRHSLLLREAPAPATTGDCSTSGAGAERSPSRWLERSPGATVWAVDSNERAVSLTRHNAERNEITNVHAVASRRGAGRRTVRRRSGRTRRSGSASRRCTTCSCGGSADSRPTARRSSSSRSTSVPTPSSAGSTAGTPDERIASRAGFRLLSVTAPD